MEAQRTYGTLPVRFSPAYLVGEIRLGTHQAPRALFANRRMGKSHPSRRDLMSLGPAGGLHNAVFESLDRDPNTAQALFAHHKFGRGAQRVVHDTQLKRLKGMRVSRPRRLERNRRGKLRWSGRGTRATVATAVLVTTNEAGRLANHALGSMRRKVPPAGAFGDSSHSLRAT